MKSENMVNVAKFLVTAENQASAVLKKVSSDVKNMSDGFAKSWKSLSDWAIKNEQSFRNMRNYGAVAFASLTAAATLSVKTFASFEKKMSEVKAVSWATADEFSLLTEEAQRVGKMTEKTASQAADWLIFLSRAWFNAKEAFDALWPSVDFATANNIDLWRSADIASNILAQYKWEVKDMPKFMDILSKTAATSNTNIEQLSEAMKYAWPSFAAFDISLAETSSAIGILWNNWLQGSLATRALWTSITRLAKPTNMMAEAMKNANIQAFDQQGNFVWLNKLVWQLEKWTAKMTDEQKQNTLASIFWSDAIQERNILVGEWEKKLTDYTNVLENSVWQTKEMARVMRDNLQWSIDNTVSAFENLQIQLWKALNPTIRWFLDETITPLLRGLWDWTKANPELASTITKVAIGMAWLVTVVGAIWLAIPAIITWFTAIWTALAILTWPIWLIIAWVIALWVVIYKNWDEIKSYTIKTRTDIKNFFTSRFAPIKESWAKLRWDNEKEFKKIWGAIKLIVWIYKTVFTTTFSVIASVVTKLWWTMWEWIKLVWKTAMSVIWNWIKARFDIIWSVFSLFKNLFSWNRQAAWDDVKNIINTEIEFITNIFWDFIWNAKQRGINMLTMFSEWLYEWIDMVKWAVTGVADKIKAFLWFASPTDEWPASDSDQRAPNFMKMFADWIISNYGLIEDATKWSADVLKVWFEEMRLSVNETLNELTEEFKSKSDELKNKTKDILTELKTLNEDFKKDTAENEKSVAEAFVEQQEKIKKMQEELNQKRMDLRNEDDADRRLKLESEIAWISDKLTVEQQALQDNADLKKQLSNEIAEIERYNALTDLERSIENFNTKQAQNLAQFNQKKLLLATELAETFKQQSQLRENYNATQQIIRDQYNITYQNYLNWLTNQSSMTKTETDKMVQNFWNVASAIEKAISKMQQLQAMWWGGGMSFAYANGGIAPWWFKAFANGGTVSTPTIWLVWEWRYNEAIVPLPDGRSIPVEMRGWQGGNSPIFNFNIWVVQGIDENTVMDILDRGTREFKTQFSFENF